MSYYNGHCDVCKKLKPLMSGICDDCAIVIKARQYGSAQSHFEEATNLYHSNLYAGFCESKGDDIGEKVQDAHKYATRKTAEVVWGNALKKIEAQRCKSTCIAVTTEDGTFLVNHTGSISQDNHEVADPAIRESDIKYMEKITNG